MRAPTQTSPDAALSQQSSLLIICQLTLHNFTQHIAQQVAPAKPTYWSHRSIYQLHKAKLNIMDWFTGPTNQQAKNLRAHFDSEIICWFFPPKSLTGKTEIAVQLIWQQHGGNHSDHHPLIASHSLVISQEINEIYSSSSHESSSNQLKDSHRQSQLHHWWRQKTHFPAETYRHISTLWLTETTINSW